MKRFEFSLQSVLHHRERVEQQATQNYAQARQAAADAEAVLADLIALRRDLMDGLSTLRLSGHIDPQEQLGYQHYIQLVTDDINKQQDTVASLWATAEDLHAELVEASQDKKAVDKLREQKLDAHSLELRRSEQDENDEMATQKFLQRRIDRAA
jgi:flagellar FliJ protein